MDEGEDYGAQAGANLSVAGVVGASTLVRTTGQILEKSSPRPDADFASGTGGKNHCGCPAGAIPSANAQSHLGTGAARGLMTTRQTLSLLREYESRNVTFIERDGSWPIVWERAKGVHVWDADGKKYLDLTAAFGVAAAGHANPRVVRAGQKQMARLLHAMGDVHPHARKAELAAKLSEITFQRWGGGTGKTLFTNSGFEAVEAALKTAFLATSRARVVAFDGAYHGLGYGA